MTQATETSSNKPKHQVLQSTESHFLDTNYLPIAHTTSQSIVALEPMDQIVYGFTEGAGITELKGTMGCTASPIEEVGEGVYQSVLTLARPLRIGQRAEIDLFTRFDFTELPPPPSRVRRRIIGPMAWRAFEVVVHFPSSNPPRTVAWAEWEDGAADTIVSESEITLGLKPMQSCSGEYVQARWSQRPAIPGRILGMHWERPV